MMKHRKDYVDMHRTTEHEKDSIEQEVSSHLTLVLDHIIYDVLLILKSIALEDSEGVTILSH